MPVGHFTSLSATNFSGGRLWYAEGGTWTANEADRYIFDQTRVAVHTAIKNLPAGYHTQVNFESKPVPAKPENQSYWTQVTC